MLFSRVTLCIYLLFSLDCPRFNATAAQVAFLFLLVECGCLIISHARQAVCIPGGVLRNFPFRIAHLSRVLRRAIFREVVNRGRRSTPQPRGFNYDLRRFFRNVRFLVRFGTRNLRRLNRFFLLAIASRRELRRDRWLFHHFCALNKAHLSGTDHCLTNVFRFSMGVRRVDRPFFNMFVRRIDDHGPYAAIRTRVRFPVRTG